MNLMKGGSRCAGRSETKERHSDLAYRPIFLFAMETYTYCLMHPIQIGLNLLLPNYPFT